MKTKLILIVITLLPLLGIGQELKSETFTVNGKCGMCKSKIEQAALSLQGVKTADWNTKKQSITVEYDTEQVQAESVQLAIALAGYDTETTKATETAYNALPACCQYRSNKMNKNGSSKAGCH